MTNMLMYMFSQLFPVLANVIRIDQDATQDGDVVMEDAPMLDAPDRLAIYQSSCQVVAFSHMSYSWEERQRVVFPGAPREIKVRSIFSHISF
jgi:hypothetical protein